MHNWLIFIKVLIVGTINKNNNIIIIIIISGGGGGGGSSSSSSSSSSSNIELKGQTTKTTNLRTTLWESVLNYSMSRQSKIARVTEWSLAG